MGQREPHEERNPRGHVPEPSCEGQMGPTEQIIRQRPKCSPALGRGEFTSVRAKGFCPRLRIRVFAQLGGFLIRAYTSNRYNFRTT